MVAMDWISGKPMKFKQLRKILASQLPQYAINLQANLLIGVRNQASAFADNSSGLSNMCTAKSAGRPVLIKR